MKIHNLSKDLHNNLVRISASVTRKDCDRHGREIYLETSSPSGADLNCNPNAFLLASIIPAWFHGEQRVLVEGKSGS